jgi:hypothetical protein
MPKLTNKVTRLGMILALTVACSMQASAQQGSEDAEIKVQQLVSNFLTAENAFDAKALAKLITKQYFEISPLGELDDHDRFLGFYAPEKRVDVPPMTLSEERCVLFAGRGQAVYTVKIAWAMKNADGSPRTIEFRGTFVAQNVGLPNGGNWWQMVSAAYTPIRTQPKS